MAATGNLNESLRWNCSFLVTVVALMAVGTVMVISIQLFLNSDVIPFCPVNNNKEFEKMVESALLGANFTPGSFCTNSTNIAVQYKNYQVGECQFFCDRKDWLKIHVSCPFSLTGLQYTTNNTANYTRCEEGKFTITFFAQLGNLVDVTSILIRNPSIVDENHGRINWLTYAARKGALSTVKKVRKVWKEFQFVDENEDINIEKPEEFCSVNPICQD